MSDRTGAEIIMDGLTDQSVPYLVGLCGHADIGLLEAARDRQDKIRTMLVHHEQTAGFIADAYYRVTQQPLATYTSVGPGSANIHTSVANALFDSSALLAITGNVSTSQFNKGPFQELGLHHQADFVTAMRPYVKRSFHAPRADMLPDMMRHAFNSMLSGRRGPVHLDVPLNVFCERTDAQPAFAEGWRRPGVYASGGVSHHLEAAMALLLGAERPVILAGHACLLDNAESEVLELAELTGIPVATTPQAKGVLDERHALCLGPTGRDGTYPANRATRGADVLLALGTRFGDRSTSSWREGVTHSSSTKLIHVDIDPNQLGRNYAPTVGIVGSVSVVLRQLIQMVRQQQHGALEASRARRKAWDQRFAGWQAAWEATHAEVGSLPDIPIHPDRFVAEVAGATPRNAIAVVDIGMNHTWMVQQWKVPKGGRLLQSGGYAAMGFGVCGALGAQLAAPDRPVVAVVGDGGFLMHNNAVATAVEYDLPVVWVIFNNTGYVSIRDLQKGAFGKDREFASRFRRGVDGPLLSADFAMMGRSMGAEGIRVERPGDVGCAVQAALASRKPTVIDVIVESEVTRRTAGVLDFPPMWGAAPNYDPDPLP